MLGASSAASSAHPHPSAPPLSRFRGRLGPLHWLLSGCGSERCRSARVASPPMVLEPAADAPCVLGRTRQSPPRPSFPSRGRASPNTYVSCGMPDSSRTARSAASVGINSWPLLFGTSPIGLTTWRALAVSSRCPRALPRRSAMSGPIRIERPRKPKDSEIRVSGEPGSIHQRSLNFFTSVLNLRS